MPELAANGTTLFYDEAGSGPAIVLTHGFGDSELFWQPQVDAFQDRFRLVTHDIRGHARSGAPEDPGTYTQDQVVEDLRAIMNTLKIKRAVIGGTRWADIRRCASTTAIRSGCAG